MVIQQWSVLKHPKTGEVTCKQLDLLVCWMIHELKNGDIVNPHVLTVSEHTHENIIYFPPLSHECPKPLASSLVLSPSQWIDLQQLFIIHVSSPHHQPLEYHPPSTNNHGIPHETTTTHYEQFIL